MKAPATVATGISVGKTFSSTPGVGISLNLRPSITQPKASFFSPSRGELPGSGFINTKFSFRESLKGSLNRPIIDISRPTQVNLTSADKQEARLKTAQEHSNAILAVIQFGNPVRLSELSRSTDGRTGVSRRSLLTAAARPSSLGVIGEINRANRVNSPDVAIFKKAPVLRRDVVRPDISKGLFSGVFTQQVDLIPKVSTPATRRRLLTEQIRSPLVMATNRLAKVSVTREITAKFVSLPEVKVVQRAVGTDVLSPGINDDSEKKKREQALAQEAAQSLVLNLIKAFAKPKQSQAGVDIVLAGRVKAIFETIPELKPKAQEVVLQALVKRQPALAFLSKAQLGEMVVSAQASGKGITQGPVVIGGSFEPLGNFFRDYRVEANRAVQLAEAVKIASFKNPHDSSDPRIYLDCGVLFYLLEERDEVTSPIALKKPGPHRDGAYTEKRLFMKSWGVVDIATFWKRHEVIKGVYKAVKFDEHGEPVSKDDVLLVLKYLTTLFPGLNINGAFAAVAKNIAGQLTKDVPQDTFAIVASKALDSLAA